MNDDKQNMIVGWRKLGIAGCAICVLCYNPPADFKIAIIIGVIAVTGIICQTYLDGKE